MKLATVALPVPDYDAAIAFFTAAGFELLEDTALGGGKRWVKVGAPEGGSALLLAQVADPVPAAGGRVAFFLETAEFEATAARLETAGAMFEEAPRDEPYGRVAVWRDPWGNRWDLIQPA
ncbi:VOC family protein [Pontivivens ytuae]|uniref:VOC family protein n=1 Tax=Pontivivens ytuae TaxID=2789856 RepID=A0A7S9LPY9_9RHOB|nr:VOC family protein [Pontivivens ytuae]QPH52984.1 VOC family protein [Pontivivens ytuae]